MAETRLMFDHPRLARFKQAYHQATTEQQEEFTFEGHKFFTGYAKYLIEYLETQLHKGKPRRLS